MSDGSDKKDKRAEERTKIVSNAARLISDAKLLADNGRFASACSLSILAVEEIGKLIHDIWNAVEPLHQKSGRRLNHRAKQAAVASLLMSKHAFDFVQTHSADGPDIDDLIEPLAKALSESEAGRFYRFVEMGAIDKTKELGLYRDEWAAEMSLYDTEFTATDVGSFFEKARTAIRLVADDLVMKAARTIYETHSAKSAR